MKILVTSKLSKNMYKTPQGYLVCKNAIFSRTGKQPYMKSEIYPNCDDDTIVEVDRREEEVFSDEAMASFENMPLTNEHPYENVTPENYKEYAVGFVRDIHKGTFKNKPVMMGTVVITDPDAIADVESGKRDLSCGYDCDITDGDHPEQINIRGNHVALCEQGRAGIAKIMDSADENYIPGYREKVVKSFNDAVEYVAGSVYKDVKGNDWKIADINSGVITLENTDNVKNKYDVAVFTDMLAKKVYVPVLNVGDTNDVSINDKTLVKYKLWPGKGYQLQEGTLELEGKIDNDDISLDQIFADAYKKNVGYFVKANELTDEDEKDFADSDRFLYVDLTTEGVDFVGYVCIENFKTDKPVYKEEGVEDSSSFTLTFANEQEAQKALDKFESDEDLKGKFENVKAEIRNEKIIISGDIAYLRGLQAELDKIYRLEQNEAEKTEYKLKNFTLDSENYSKRFYKELKKTLEENLDELNDFEIVLDDDDQENVQRSRNNLKREVRRQILNTKEKLK